MQSISPLCRDGKYCGRTLAFTQDNGIGILARQHTLMNFSKCVFSDCPFRLISSDRRTLVPGIFEVSNFHFVLFNSSSVRFVSLGSSVIFKVTSDGTGRNLNSSASRLAKELGSMRYSFRFELDHVGERVSTTF